jgi:hypothetical protein
MLCRHRRLRPVVLSLLSAVAALVQPIAHGDEEQSTEPVPTLMVLELGERGNSRALEIKVAPGATISPLSGARPQRWVLRPGDSIAAGTRPPDRLVELYSGTAQSHALICKVGLRYVRAPSGLWVAHFQLIEEPLVARQGDRWVPITTLQGAQNLIVLTSSTLPNAEGFYPALEFGFTNEAPPLDFWVVR